MKKIINSLFFICIFFLMPNLVFAKSESFVTVVNPIRGSDFWQNSKQTPTTSILGEYKILQKNNIPATWLIRYDALKNNKILDLIKSFNSNFEKGLFLEVTPTWTSAAEVNYRKSNSWHNAGSVLLPGYDQSERIKLIDTAFEEFKSIFGSYPKSVGAWWIDSYSISYMQSKYGISSALIVADQYTTDNYQIWGQYWGTPYYPAKTNALNPAQNIDEKLPVVMMQWATRDPVGGYGKGVEESTLSVQPNDYIDYHNLNTDYFSKLIDVYTKQDLNSFNQIVVGLENSYSWDKYKGEYQKEIEVLSQKSHSGQFSIVTMKDFSNWYITNFPGISPSHIIIADDPLGSGKKAVWFMDPFYRAGWIYNKVGVFFRDIRQYINTEEICFSKSCSEINFATNATRVLDQVTNGDTWVLDIGKISNFNVSKENDNYIIKYVNEAGKSQSVGFLPKDISFNDKILSIDSAILSAVTKSKEGINSTVLGKGTFDISIVDALFKLLKFFTFAILALFIPGFFVLAKSIKLQEQNILNLFLSVCIGIVFFTLVSYGSSLIGLWWITVIYVFVMDTLFIYKKLYKYINFSWNNQSLLFIGIIILGTIFQVTPVFKSGLIYDVGMGFWGPNTHDGIWHIALVNQLIRGVPPQNPIFSGQTLTNYHYFYDLLIAVTYKVIRVPIVDLIFRCYPVIFSLLLGIGTYFLSMKIVKSKIVAFFSIYLVYFTGSFGWVVEFLRERHFGGESSFWSNQPISFNLNPPFAISLVILLAIINLFFINFDKGKETLKRNILLILMVGSLVEFKAYAAILAIGALILLSLIRMFKKQFSPLFLVFGSAIISIVLLIPNYTFNQLTGASKSIFIWSPFWFVNSMIDSPDRVGWTRLSLMRMVGEEKHNWFKYILAETIGLIIFWGGNLGVRFFSFGLLGKTKTIFKNEGYLYIFLLTSLSLIIPVFFIQSGNPWNSIQFMYYGLYLSAIGTAVVLGWMIHKLKVLGKILVVIILLITPINAIVTASGYVYYLPHASIGTSELLGLNYLYSQPEGIVLSPPFNSDLRNNTESPIPIYLYDTTAYVSAFSDKQNFVEDESQLDILQNNYKDRIIKSKNFFNGAGLEWSKKFLKDNKIDYIYIPKQLYRYLDVGGLNLKNIYSNQSVLIYRVDN